MIQKVKDGLIIVALIIAALFIYILVQANRAQDEAFQVFKTDSEARQAEAFRKIDSLQVQADAAGEDVKDARADRDRRRVLPIERGADIAGT